jgi:hypothetical protein
VKIIIKRWLSRKTNTDGSKTLSDIHSLGRFVLMILNPKDFLLYYSPAFISNVSEVCKSLRHIPGATLTEGEKFLAGILKRFLTDAKYKKVPTIHLERSDYSYLYYFYEICDTYKREDSIESPKAKDCAELILLEVSFMISPKFNGNEIWLNSLDYVKAINKIIHNMLCSNHRKSSRNHLIKALFETLVRDTRDYKRLSEGAFNTLHIVYDVCFKESESKYIDKITQYITIRLSRVEVTESQILDDIYTLFFLDMIMRTNYDSKIPLIVECCKVALDILDIIVKPEVVYKDQYPRFGVFWKTAFNKYSFHLPEWENIIHYDSDDSLNLEKRLDTISEVKAQLLLYIKNNS